MMVNIESDLNDGHCRFVLSPNQSLSWRGSLWFFLSLLLVSSVIAVSMTMLGFWLILPFAGLEMLALGLGLYVVACRCYEREVILIGAEDIRIERGRGYPRQHFTVGRVWARVVLERCPRDWYPSKLLIRSHGRAVEVGRFLHEEERRQLATALTHSLRYDPRVPSSAAGTVGKTF
ncbi:MAG: DUF2244 domain-containing protein [Candidatus Competibacteraceae bacterium]|jgi:uncharacterized membrane protein|nr:DUF2244 domain-containing protein [Candidatus Competibacteraceae bacterium]